MNYYERLLDRDFVARTVMIIQRSLCAYRSPGDPLQRRHCDCKYGLAEKSDEEVCRLIKGNTGEQNGCCELAALEHIIRSISARDWLRIVRNAVEPKKRQVRKAKKSAHAQVVDAMREKYEPKATPKPRHLSVIAAEIKKDWKRVYFGAVPTLKALAYIGNINEAYGCDDGKSIVASFLANAGSWRGDVARRVKKELRDMLK